MNICICKSSSSNDLIVEELLLLTFSLQYYTIFVIFRCSWFTHNAVLEYKIENKIGICK